MEGFLVIDSNTQIAAAAREYVAARRAVRVAQQHLRGCDRGCAPLLLDLSRAETTARCRYEDLDYIVREHPQPEGDRP